MERICSLLIKKVNFKYHIKEKSQPVKNDSFWDIILTYFYNKAHYAYNAPPLELQDGLIGYSL
jgi:hypothetical protein